MGDVTANATFSQTVMGNRRVVYADCPAGGTTADTIVIPGVRAVNFAAACFRSSVAAASSVCPSLSIEGTTVTIFQNAATTGTAYTIRAEGR